ncbi:MAG: hypothetical protein R3242_01930 [Akkermansiaceae bacterium]|nr:hypothetical protein [Akkermansiaceae bacterium]
MKSFPILWIPLTGIALALASCDSGDDPDGADQAHAETITNRIDIPPTVRSNLGITFAKVERRAVASTLRVPGAFELKPLARHEYRLMLPAQVRLEVEELQTVKAGDLLYRFQSPQWLDLQSRIELAVASYKQASLKHEVLKKRLEALNQADFKNAELEAQAANSAADLARYKAELDAALISATNLLNAYRAKEDALEPEALLEPVDVKGAQVPHYRSIDWIEARAIEAGVVQSLAVTDGGYVEATTLVLTTVDPSQVRFRALGLQSDLAKFEEAKIARIVPPQGNDGDINQSMPATLRIGLDEHPRERAITLIAEPEQTPDWARPGVTGFLEVVTQSTGGVVLAIPRSAVVKDGIQHVFFKRDPMNPNKAVRVEADLGVDDGRWVEIQSGIGPNDEVVLEGAYELKLTSSQSGTSQKGGHFHADGTFHAEDH